jgi:hypothetical protein
MSRTSTVFVAGSRLISRLPTEVRIRLDTMIEKGFRILVCSPRFPVHFSPLLAMRRVTHASR